MFQMADEYNLEKELKITKGDRIFARKIEYLFKMFIYGVACGIILFILFVLLLSPK